MGLFAGRIGFRRSAPRSLAIVAACVVLAGCASTGGIAGLFGGGSSNSREPDFDTEDFLRPAYCPPVEFRIYAETLQVFVKGQEGRQDQIRYQASIGKMARECSTPTAGTMAVKLGISGRVVAGPKGGAGNVDLPVRVAVVKQSDNTVLFTELFRFPVTVAAPSYGADFSQVIDQVSFPLGPDDHDLIIYVGFDLNAG